MNIIQIYGTPIWESAFPGFEQFQTQFLDCVREYREKNPNSDNRSAINGFQSGREFLHADAMAPLFDFVGQMAMKATFDLQFIGCDVFLTSAWFNINDNRTCINTEHVHPNTFTGVFYLKAPPGSGQLVLNNPGLNPMWQGVYLIDRKNKYTSDRVKITPVDGQVFLWPSYLAHSVEPNQHDDERIAISFDVICMPKNLNEQIDDAKDNTPDSTI